MSPKPILIPIAENGSMMNAAVYARQLLNGDFNGFTLLRTYIDMAGTDPLFPGPTPGLLDAVEATVRQEATELRSRLGSDAPGITTLVSYGTLGGEVEHLTASGQFSMVLMEGEEEHGMFKEGAGAVVKASHVPVLVVPGHSRFQGVRHILLADDEGEVRPGSLLPLLAIARNTGAEIVVLRVLPPDRPDTGVDGSRMHHALLSEVPHSFLTVHSDDIAQAISEQVTRTDAQLVVLLHRHRGLLDGLFHHSLAKELATGTDVPLMVLEQ
jgi:nucleotide-binding universal stress UspA family protein